MKKSASSARARSAAALTVLDPATLGRPVHLLGGFTARFQAALAETLRVSLNRRYSAGFEIESVELHRRATPSVPSRWLACATPAGVVTCTLDRRLLLAVMGYRYGEPVAPAADDTSTDAPVPETATEERLAATVCARWTETLLGCIDAQFAAEVTASPTPAPAATTTAWTLRVQLAETRLALSGELIFVLDDAVMACLLRSLSVGRERARPLAAPSEPLTRRLSLPLTARLLTLELPLGTVLDLRPGHVLPVSLGPAEVLVDDACLFRADVAEHKGKLCLTSFDDVE